MGDVNAQITFAPISAHGNQTDLSAVFTPTIPDGATQICVQAITANVRYTLDGQDPTASFGFQITASDVERIIPVKKGRTVLKFIQEAAGAKLQYQFGSYI